MDEKWHETAIIYEAAMIGKNCRIDEHVIIKPYAYIGNDCIVKCKAIISTGVKVGNRCFIGPGALLLHEGHEGTHLPSIVKDDCYIGGGAVLLPGVVLCGFVIIGAGSIVTRGEYEEGVYVGNPARRIR